MLWIVWLALRWRRPGAFTAANPGMDLGGVVGERKSTLLLSLQALRPEAVPATELLPREAARKRSAALAFAARHGYPLVLKPDIGQRGRGVAIVRDEKALLAYLGRADFAVLAQRFAPGAEFGVFVYRDPADWRLHILSITEKRLTAVRGDGRRSLRALILADQRARLIAPLLFRRHAQRLDEVPEADRELPLVELGTHCRGALFLDGCALASEDLRAELDRITAALLPGFHFGRLDLKAPDRDALRAGRGLQIMELNGVTAESAHVYQPGTPLLTGYRAFFRQWSLAFRIGAANARAGAVSIAPPWLLLFLCRDLRRAQAAESAALVSAG